MAIQFGDENLIKKRRKQESCYGFAEVIKNAIDNYSQSIPPNQMGKIIREVGSTIFIDDDINYFIEFRDGLDGRP